jgi:hypothetical protein
MTAEERDKLLENEINYYTKTTKRWKLAYRVFLILSACLSAGAAIVVKLHFIGNPELASDISSILAALATIATTIVASLNFENFWRANQKARERVRILRLEALKKDSDSETNTTIDGLIEIIQQRSESLLKDD